MEENSSFKLVIFFIWLWSSSWFINLPTVMPTLLVAQPRIENEECWFKFIFGMNPQGIPDSEEIVGTPPLLPIISSLNQVRYLMFFKQVSTQLHWNSLLQFKVETLLEYNVNWLEKGGFSLYQGQWLYALLVRLEKPLKPEMCSLLRSLARTCSIIRKSLQSPSDPTLPQLNLFICLVGHYFDQSDLSEKWEKDSIDLPYSLSTLFCHFQLDGKMHANIFKQQSIWKKISCDRVWMGRWRDRLQIAYILQYAS